MTTIGKVEFPDPEVDEDYIAVFMHTGACDEYTHVWTDTHTHTQMDTHVWTQMHKYIFAYAHAQLHTYTCSHTYAHAYKCTHTHQHGHECKDTEATNCDIRSWRNSQYPTSPTADKMLEHWRKNAIFESQVDLLIMMQVGG